MTKTNFITLCLMAMVFMSACSSQKEFISDADFRNTVEHDFAAKKRVMKDGALFQIFEDSMSHEERGALMFMYASMPLGDVTDYTGKFYLDNVRASFKVKEEMPWGDTIPEYIFRHFVLPIRVNNENLDESRMVFYEELRDRVKNLSLHDAVLEVNHWCHEKAIYAPSDGRTSSPLASVKTAFGRCGEETVFAVAALRSVGIPARQVYTPRWAHTDNNHAWVEAWVDGEWKFFGACEPEPVLNKGWFNGPAYRGILMHTKVFGKYNGPEEIMTSTEAFTEVNITENYAPVTVAEILVVDEADKAVADADVEFQIYNYAQFYSSAHKTTNKEGKSVITAGKGDMLVWASKDGKFGFGKISFKTDSLLKIVLKYSSGDAIAMVSLDIVPPVDGSIPAHATQEQADANSKRLQAEDVIRNSYTSTFYTKERAEALAKELGLDPVKTEKYMLSSRGNHDQIEAFLRSTSASKREVAMALLGVISEKDLRDTDASVLVDHLSNTPSSDSEWFDMYLMNPRVALEFITAYKGEISEKIDPALVKSAKEDPIALVDWVKSNITVNNDLNPQGIVMMPLGVLNSRVADINSLNIFFVSVARSIGIPARIEPVAKKTQYFHDGLWMDVDFDAAVPISAKQGTLIANYTAVPALEDPKYYSQFTIAKILDNGKLQTLNFRRGGDSDMGIGDTWSSMLKEPLALDEGNYMLTTGSRLADGTVLANLSFFTIKDKSLTEIDLHVRDSKVEVEVIGSLSSANKFKGVSSDKVSTLLATAGEGYYVVAILGAKQEPTNHAMRDMSAVKSQLEAWGGDIVLLFPEEKGWSNFNATEFGTLPSTITYGLDIENKIQNEIVANLKLSSATNLPIFVIANSSNEVVFVSQGYTIGLGEQMLSVINKL